MNPDRKFKIKSGLIAALFMGVGVLLAFLVFNTTGYQKIKSTDMEANTAGIYRGTAGPQETFYFIKDPKKKPRVSALSYYVGDLDTGELILEKNKEEKFPIASVSKLMTATVSDDARTPEKEIKITKEALATEGENGGFRLNEVVKVKDLLYPLLLESSNDAAEALARGFGRETFLAAMNKKANSIGMLSTSFLDPSGLSEKNISTSFDLFKFAKYLKSSKPDLLRITTEKSFSNKKHVWFNNSQFLGTDGYEGGKRGFIDESLQTVVSLFNVSLSSAAPRNIGIVLLKSPDRYKDVTNILAYLKGNIFYGTEKEANMAWFKQKDGIVEEKEPNYVNLVFGGDIMLDRGVKISVLKNFKGDYSRLFENLDILKKADIAFANLEGPASDKGKDLHNLYSFRMDPSVIPALKGAGLTILSVANNHVGDWGREAYADTLKRLDENEILYAGGGNTYTGAIQPRIIEKYGMKIGYLAFSDKGPESMAVIDEKAGLLLASDPNFDQIVQNAAGQVDALVVSFHFGEEYEKKHNARQEYLAHRAIDDGARIIIGAHPHVVQDTEVYKNGFIAYSLGNFIFDQKFSAATMQGMLLGITLGRDGSMSVNKNIVKLNSVFQPQKIIPAKSEIIKFPVSKTPGASI